MKLRGILWFSAVLLFVLILLIRLQLGPVHGEHSLQSTRGHRSEWLCRARDGHFSLAIIHTLVV